MPLEGFEERTKAMDHSNPFPSCLCVGLGKENRSRDEEIGGEGAEVAKKNDQSLKPSACMWDWRGFGIGSGSMSRSLAPSKTGSKNNAEDCDR